MEMDRQSVTIRPSHREQHAVSALHSGADTDLPSAYLVERSPVKQADTLDGVHSSERGLNEQKMENHFTCMLGFLESAKNLRLLPYAERGEKPTWNS